MTLPPSKNDTERIWFAHMLRAVAVLVVMVSHYCDVFVHANSVVVGLAYTQPVTLDPDLLLPKIILWLYKFNFNAGPFGVAIFFLISGFVIPISIEHIGSGLFLLRRFFRIYPPYIVGLFLVFISVYIYTNYVGNPFPYTVKDYVVNASLLRDWFWIPSIDGVNWTLEVELKFYILCAFLAWVSNLRSPKTLIITAIGMLVFVYLSSGLYEFLLQNFFYLYKFTFIMSSAFGYITFMFIGICFYNFYMSHWSTRVFLSTTGILIAIFLLDVLLSPSPVLVIPVSYNYMFALVVFSLCYFFRDKLPYSKVLDFLATLSYPIYIIHGVIGYILLTVLVTHNVNFYIALVIVFFIIVSLAYLLHKTVEMPANKLGKQVSKFVKNVLV